MVTRPPLLALTGYKGHVAVDLEIITDMAVTAGNANHASVAQNLINDLDSRGT